MAFIILDDNSILIYLIQPLNILDRVYKKSYGTLEYCIYVCVKYFIIAWISPSPYLFTHPYTSGGFFTNKE